jgi:hypothetical protein
MKRKALLAGGLAVLLPCLLAFTIRTDGSQLLGQAAKGWPVQFGTRKLYPCEYGSIYAAKKSGADQAKKVLATVVKDLKQAGVTNPANGLILVRDNKEDLPIETDKLIEAVSKAEAQKGGEKSEDTLKTLTEAKEEMEKEGLDVEVVLSLVPIPIGPGGLPKVLRELPGDANQPIGWCIIVPTDACVKAGLKKIIEFGMKKGKAGLAERLAVGALMPLIEHKAAEQVRKTWQAVLYQLLLDAERDLPKQQKQEMLRAYKQKLGLDDDSKEGDREQHSQEKEENSEQ